MNAKQRMKWLDIAKGIAILCTIIGHTVNGTIQGIICSFHMPLFFLLAGYTFREVPASEIKTEIKKDVSRLLLPYIAVILIRILIDICFCHQRIGETLIQYLAAAFLGYGAAYLGNPFWFWLGATWFLAALFWSRLAYRFVLLYVKEYRQIFILVLAFFSIWLGQIVWLPQSWDLVFPCLIFMEAGYLLKNHEINIKKEIWQGTGVVAFFIWTIYLHFSRGGKTLAGRTNI